MNRSRNAIKKFIDELPPGRTPVNTVLIPEQRRPDVRDLLHPQSLGAHRLRHRRPRWRLCLQPCADPVAQQHLRDRRQRGDRQQEPEREGDPAGFVRVLDDTTLAIPERPGNRQAATFSNLVQNRRVGLLFMIPFVVVGVGLATLAPDLFSSVVKPVQTGDAQVLKALSAAKNDDPIATAALLKSFAAQLAACSLVPNAALETSPDDVQLGLTHGALEPEQQAIIEQRWVVQAVGVTDEGVGHRAQVEQP